jgi:hypothetical protein
MVHGAPSRSYIWRNVARPRSATPNTAAGDVPTDGPERADELASKAAEAALRAVEDNG